ncbi:MAG: capping complex subunit for YIEGIA [Bacillota bacterium]
MEFLVQESIMAVVTTDREKVIPGGAPVFLAKDEEEQEKISLYISRILNGIAHDLENGVYIIVRH